MEPPLPLQLIRGRQEEVNHSIIIVGGMEEMGGGADDDNVFADAMRLC